MLSTKNSNQIVMMTSRYVCTLLFFCQESMSREWRGWNSSGNEIANLKDRLELRAKSS